MPFFPRFIRSMGGVKWVERMLLFRRPKTVQYTQIGVRSPSAAAEMARTAIRDLANRMIEEVFTGDLTFTWLQDGVQKSNTVACMATISFQWGNVTSTAPDAQNVTVPQQSPFIPGLGNCRLTLQSPNPVRTDLTSTIFNLSVVRLSADFA